MSNLLIACSYLTVYIYIYEFLVIGLFSNNVILSEVYTGGSLVAIVET